MNEIVQERRGDIFATAKEHHSPGIRSMGADSHKNSTEFGKEPMSSHMKRTGTLRKSIMQSSGANYMNRNASQTNK
jgi:hypothetical protein